MITTARIAAVEEARHVAKKLTPEEIGTALGRLARRIDQWKETKAELLTEAERLAGLARGLVAELQGTGIGSAATAAASGRSRRGGRPKGMKVSEATKAKLRAAWKRRKAAAGKAKTTKGATAAVASASPAKRSRGGRPKGMKLSEETRAKLRAAWKRRKAAAKRTA